MTGSVDAAAIDDAWEARVLPTLSEYTRIPCLSPAYDPDWAERGAIAEAAALLRSWVRDQEPALQTEIVQLPGRTPVLLIDNGGSGEPIVVYGHMDKQPPLGEWRSGLGPYEPVREGDLLYGRGTADDGYSMFAAVTGLLAAGGGHGRVLILIEASEESGSPDLAAHLENLEERIGTPRLVICLDSGGLSYDRLWLTTSLRGNLVATVRVDVLTEGIHSGQGGGVVPSSFRIQRRILSGIEDEATGRILLPELVGAGIPAAHRANIEALAVEFPESAAPIVDGLHLLTPDPVDRLTARTWGAALEVTGADGLPKPSDGGNVLRPSTTLKLSLRLPPDVDAEAACDALDLGPPHGRGGARHDRHGGGGAGMDRPAARAGRGGHVVGRLEGALRAGLRLGGRGWLHPLPARSAEGVPADPLRGDGGPRAALERTRPQRGPAHPDGQGGHPCRRRAPALRIGSRP